MAWAPGRVRSRCLASWCAPRGRRVAVASARPDTRLGACGKVVQIELGVRLTLALLTHHRRAEHLVDAAHQIDHAVADGRRLRLDGRELEGARVGEAVDMLAVRAAALRSGVHARASGAAGALRVLRTRMCVAQAYRS